MPLIHLVQLEHYPILKQLQLEEALLRTDNRNWCLINKGSPAAIVMGISGKPELLIDAERQFRNPLPIIRRFSGGGTVVVDEDTYFVTFICNSDELQVPCYPEHVLRWSAKIYNEVFQDKFILKENDYAFGDRKFGGNAQYFRKDRWLHHTSLLWDFKHELMEYLLLPSKAPQYRAGRAHSDFLCRLKEHHTNKEELDHNFLRVLSNGFEIQKIKLEEMEKALEQSHRKATALVKFKNHRKNVGHGTDQPGL